MKRKLMIAVVVIVSAMLSAGSLHGRGFGGGHMGGGGFGGGGGGFGGGGYGGGGFHGGGYGGGGFGGGDFRGYGGGAGGFGGDGGYHGGEFAGGLGAGGYGSGGFGQARAGQEAFGTGGLGGGRFDAGGAGRFGEGGLQGAAGERAGGLDGLNRDGQFGGGEFGRGFGGAAPSAARLNSFLGLPTDSGMSAAGGRDVGGLSGNARGLSSLNTAAAGERGASGTVIHGPDGGTVAHGQAGKRGAVAGPGGIAGGERGARGTVIKGPDGGVYAHGETGGRGFYNGARGAGTWHWSAADGRLQGNYVRNDFRNWNAFDHNWYRRYPNAWWARGFAAGFWTACTWGAINDWFGVDWEPVGYYYGDNITYVDNNVCLDGQPIATSADYYQSAVDLAQTGQQADVPSEQPPADGDLFAPQQALADQANAQWLPLGVFEAVPPADKSSKMTFQLAVNKDGIVRGNYFNTGDNNVQQVQGAVDKQTQRITWVVADRKNIIFDTGLYNLTRDETTLLVHEGPDKTEQWTMVRLKQPANGGGTNQTNQPNQ